MYTKKVYVNGTTPAINATNLNSSEQGIYDAQLYGADAGGDDTYVVNLSASSLFAGMTIRLLVTTGNTGACSLSIDNGTTTKSIKVVFSSGLADPRTGDIPAGAIITLAYDGTYWQLQGKFVESGIISMWSGTLANIPVGWVLCDGTNSTPDLRDKFVRGAANGADPGTTGGSDSITLAVENLPIHTHTGTTATESAHTHSTNIQSGGGGVSVANARNSADGSGTYITSGAGSAHSHTFTSDSTGSGTSFDNKPAYYAVAFIMHI